MPESSINILYLHDMLPEAPPHMTVARADARAIMLDVLLFENSYVTATGKDCPTHAHVDWREARSNSAIRSSGPEEPQEGPSSSETPEGEAGAASGPGAFLTILEVTPAVENTWKSIEEALRPLAQDDTGALEIASAFYDVAWIPLEAPWRTYTEAMDHGHEGHTFATTWRNAGSMVAELRGQGETYMDWCYDAVSGSISPRVLAIMAALGLKPVL